MELKYDCTSPMTKRLLEASKCRSLEELKVYLENAKREVIQLMNEDINVTIDNFVEGKKITSTLAAILAAKNIDYLWILFGETGLVNKSAAKCRFCGHSGEL